MSEISSIEPSEEEIAKHGNKDKARKAPNIKWNDRSYKSYIDNGLDVEGFNG
jgi:hypothetical protein